MWRRVMKRRLVICTFAALAFAGSSPAEAVRYGNCYWDGTSPICNGSCRSGFYVRGYKACFAGYKVKCCEPMGSISTPLRRR